MPRDHRRDLACIGLLALAVLAFFWPLTLTQAWIPRGGGDLVSFLWPMTRFAARSLRSGTVPLWNPYLYSGAPFAADNQSGLFYPVNLVTFALFGSPSYLVMEGLVVLHIWLAAVGTYVMLRSMRLRPSAAVFGGLAFALSDLFVTHIGNLNLNATAAWLPFALWASHRALRRSSVGWAVGAGAIVAVAALAGHAQMLLFVCLALALLHLYHVVRALVAHEADARRKILRTLGLALLTAAVGLGGAALMLVPAWQMASHTGRGHLPYQEATRYSLPPRALIGLLAPGFYGRGAANFWGSWERVEVGYAGVATVVLALLGTVLAVRSVWMRSPATDKKKSDPRPQQGFPVAFFAGLIPLAFLLAMGSHTPLYRLPYRFVPTFDQIRAPARLIVLGNIGLAALAAYGLDRIVAAPQLTRRYQRAALAAAACAAATLLIVGLPQAHALAPAHRLASTTRSITIAAALLILSGTAISLVQWRRWTRWLLPLLLAADLIALGSTLEIERNNPTLGFRHADIVAFLKSDPDLFRIEDNAPAWQPDAALIHELYDIGGVYNPLGIAPYEAYRWALGQRGSPLHNFLGVKYVLAGKGSPPGDETLVPVFAGEEIDVYLNTAAYPRALFVNQAEIVEDHEAAWRAIHTPGFDPRRKLVLEQGPDVHAVPPAGGTGLAQLSFVRYGLNDVAVSVNAPHAGWLVLSDVYYPGWRAAVDGVTTPVLRANYTFRAVRVPAGDHLVEMTFAPWTWHVGLLISTLTWTGIAAACFCQSNIAAALLRRCHSPSRHHG